MCCTELVAKLSLHVCVKKGQGLKGDKILYCALFLTCFIVCSLIAIETSSVFLPTDKLKLILESILGVATVYSLSRVLKRVHLAYHVIHQIQTPDCGGTLHRNLNASVPDPTFPVPTQKKSSSMAMRN